MIPISRELQDRLLSVLGKESVATFDQQCLRCKHHIKLRDPVKIGSFNVFSHDPIWMHPECADFTIENLGLFEVDDGWRRITVRQRCADCKTVMPPESKMYRVWPTVPRRNPVLCYVCHPCWRTRNYQWIDAR